MALTKPEKCKGFTFLGLLATMAIVAIGMAGVGVVWSKSAKREREKELLFIGQAYQSAIGSYYENKTGTAKKQYPQKLEDLVEDKRNGTKVVRHLRKLYEDPMTRGSTWGLIKQQGGIVGVFSTSTDEPIRKSEFDNANTYQDWVFKFSLNESKKNNQGNSALFNKDSDVDTPDKEADVPNQEQKSTFRFRTPEQIQQEIDKKYEPYKENPDLVETLWE